jgi:hypothetical protein
MSVRGGTTGSDRRGGRWALVAALGLIAGTSTAVVISQSASAATSLQAPERLYTSIDTPI